MWRHVFIAGLAIGIGFVHAQPLYRWKDAAGVTHYSAHPPPEQAGVAVDMTNARVNPADRNAALARMQRSPQDQNGDQLAPPVPAPSAAAAPVLKPRKVAAPAKKTANLESNEACATAWQAYLDSDACFAPYRAGPSAIRAEAFQHCHDVPQPDCARPSR